MKYRPFGKTGIEISAVSYGGIVSSGVHRSLTFPHENQQDSDRYVAFAIARGVNYFDVAPTYGNAQEQLGNSLVPYRSRIHLACKTLKRDRQGAEKELEESLRLLHTDHFDVYQLHQIESLEDVERAFAPGGVMELMDTLKSRGIANHIGFTAHNEDAALKMLELYPFESVLFPINWLMNMSRGMGNRLIAKAKELGIGLLAMKAFIERRWEENEDKGCFPKSWCKPIDPEFEPDFCKAAMRYTLALGVDTLIPPGNFKSFSFAADNIDDCIEHPEPDRALLAEKFAQFKGKEFF